METPSSNYLARHSPLKAPESLHKNVMNRSKPIPIETQSMANACLHRQHNNGVVKSIRMKQSLRKNKLSQLPLGRFSLCDEKSQTF